MHITKQSSIASDLVAALGDFLRDPYAPPDREEMAKACKELDRMREETRKTKGEVAVAVDLIRDARK
jgi:hypothetical protein